MTRHPRSTSRDVRKKKDLDEDPGRPLSNVTLDAKGKTERGSSKEEHRVDALALRAEERRDKLRKAAGSCK